MISVINQLQLLLEEDYCQEDFECEDNYCDLKLALDKNIINGDNSFENLLICDLTATTCDANNVKTEPSR